MKWRSRLPEPGTLPISDEKYRILVFKDEQLLLCRRRWNIECGAQPFNFMHAWIIAGADTRIALTRIAQS